MRWDPTIDGQVRRYHPPKGTPRRCSRHDVVYVNGIRTDGASHRNTARSIAAIVQQPVYGVFNKSDGFILDLVQCANDWLDWYPGMLKQMRKALLAASVAGPVAGIAASQLAAFAGTQATLWSLFDVSLQSMLLDTPNQRLHLRHRWAKEVLKSNKATLALYELLFRLSQKARVIHLVAHSQGNLISANALSALKLVTSKISNIHVYGLASPSPRWPHGMASLQLYTNTHDIVPYLSLGRSARSNSTVYKRDWDTVHSVDNHLGRTGFAKRIRSRLGLPALSQSSSHLLAAAGQR